MRIYVTVKLKAKNTRVVSIDATHFIVHVHEAPVEGRANKAVIKALAEHFNIPPSRIMIVSGNTSREKIIEID